MTKIISCQATELQNTAALTQEDWIEMGNEVLADLRDYYKTPAGKRAIRNAKRRWARWNEKMINFDGDFSDMATTPVEDNGLDGLDEIDPEVLKAFLEGQA